MAVVGQDSLWWVGVLLSIFAAFFGSLGDNLIKLSYTTNDIAVENGEKYTPLACRPLWWAGMLCLVVINTVLTLVAYTLADASLTIPFAGLHICFNIGFARLLNREQFTSRQVGFTFIILVGVTVVLVSGNHDTVTFSVSEMEDLFRETPFILTTSIMLLIIMILAPIAFMHPDPRARCLCTSALVGTIGSCTQVFAKTMAESFDEAVDNRSTSIFQSFVPGVAIAATTVCALTQLTMLNIALARFNAFVVVPIVNSTMIVLGSLYAAIFFQEFKRFDLESKILMPVGILTTSVGVALLAWDHDPEQASELVTGSPTNEHGIAMMERSHSFGGFHDSSHYDELRLPFQRSPTHPGPLRSSISSPGGSYQGLQEHEHFQRIQPSTQLETEDDDDEEYHRETSMTLS